MKALRTKIARKSMMVRLSSAGNATAILSHGWAEQPDWGARIANCVTSFPALTASERNKNGSPSLRHFRGNYEHQSHSSLSVAVRICRRAGSNPTSQPAAEQNPNGYAQGTTTTTTGETIPLFKVQVVSRSIEAVNYRHLGGETKVG